MGKRNRSCTSVEELRKNEKKIKPSLFGETPPHQNKLLRCKKNKKHKNLNDPLEHKLIQEKNVYKESEPVEFETNKVETGTDNKTYVNYNVLKINGNSIDKIKPEGSQKSNLLASSPYNNVKTKKKNKTEGFLPNKKNIFTDGQPIKVDNQNIKVSKMDNTIFLQEDDVKDEDIDKFCGEITEEDNEHYKNWIELIEAKLSSNKKKPN